ncbi:GNAT family N-acetyltransferase [Streptomyces sp. H39-S7]|uniref:GNAT family N-acetyltransferase n=1 Tax=Streptomyces sp. H39-S7 TaxID=3004357 RepID=UPI002F35CCB8
MPATASAPGLLLRPWNDGDVTAVYEAHQDPVLRRWTLSPLNSPADAAQWLRTQDRGWETGERRGFAVLESSPRTAEDRLVANVVLKGAGAGKPAAEVGYWTVESARGRGVASRALEALTTWAFATFAADGLKRLELLHQVDNVASCRVAGKSGYRLDRVLPAQPPFPADGHLHVREAPRAA